MYILSFVLIYVAFGISSYAVFEPCPKSKRQLPHGHSWEDHCCLTHVHNSVKSLIYATLLPFILYFKASLFSFAPNMSCGAGQWHGAISLCPYATLLL